MKEEKEKTIQDVISRRKQHTRRVDSKLIMKAYNYAYSYHGDQCRKSGEPYIIHPLNVAYILADIGLDDSTICAALLHDVVEDTEVTQEDITREFGKEISDMVAGVTKLSNIQFSSVEEQQVEDYRKMFLAMGKDIRVIIIKLADRLHNMRTLEYKSEFKQKKIQLKLLDYIKQEPSYVYTCDIPENGYLYEDRTLNQQFPSIKDKLYKINNIFNLEFEDTDTGQEIYSKMVYAFETSKKASMVLLKYGIKGITYVGEQDGRCFVIFNPKDVQVLDVKRFKLNEYFQNYGILYHGTDASFDNFNKDYQNGGYLGKGFYFTMNKSMAKSYGNNIIQAKLNYKNSFFFNVDTLSNNMIIEMLDTTQAQNYQKERILNLYHSLVNDNGFYDANSKLFDFVDTFNGDSTLILQKYGYDSIDNIDRDSEFVVFEPEQIQIIFVIKKRSIRSSFLFNWK